VENSLHIRDDRISLSCTHITVAIDAGVGEMFTSENIIILAGGIFIYGNPPHQRIIIFFLFPSDPQSRALTSTIHPLPPPITTTPQPLHLLALLTCLAYS
jgi:hypothetical protein